MARLDMIQSWRHWISWATEQKRVHRVLQRFGKRSGLTTFTLWRVAVRQAQAARSLIRRYQSQARSRVGMAVLCAWSIVTEGGRVERQLVQRALRKLDRRRLAAAVADWAESIRLVRLVRRVGSHMVQREKRAAFNSWVDQVRLLAASVGAWVWAGALGQGRGHLANEVNRK